MATFDTLYLTNRTAPYTPATIRGTYDDTGGAVVKALDPTKPADGGICTSVSRAETSATNPYRVLLYRGISGPLAAQTISGTVDVIIGIFESNAAADLNWHLHIYVTQGDSDTPRGTLLSDYEESAGTNEWPTTATGKGLNAAATLSSLAISDGDRIVVELGYTARNAVTTSYSGRIYYGMTVNGIVKPDLAVGGTDMNTVGSIKFSSAITDGSYQVRDTETGLEIVGTDDIDARVTEVGLEVAWEVPINSRVTEVGLEIAYVPLPCPTVSAGPSVCGDEDVLTWIETTRKQADDTVVIGAMSDIALNDPSSYYNGRKEPVILSFPKVERHLSDALGQWQANTATWTLAEITNAVRQLFGQAANYAVTNTLIVVRMIKYSSYLLRLAPRLLFIGHLLRTTPNEDFSTEQEAGDMLARDLMASGNGEEMQCPRRLFAQTSTPGIPDALVNVPEPIIYGKMSDALAADTPPELISDAAWGWGMDGSYPNFGWAAMPGPLPPTSLVITEMAGGNINLSDYPSNVFYINIVGYDSNGVFGDFSSFNQRIGPVDNYTLSASGKKIHVAWTNPGTNTAAYWRVAMGLQYFGVRYIQYVEVPGASTSCDFDNTPSYTEWTNADQSQLATGARACYDAFANYRVAAKMADGSWTALQAATNTGFGEQAVYVRTVHIQVDAASVPAGATHVGIWKVPYAAALVPVGMVEVAISHTDSGGYIYYDDDFSGSGWAQVPFPLEVGLCPLNAYYGGQEVVPTYGILMHRWFVASHAVAQIDLYLDGVKFDEGVYSVTWWAPGHGNYDTAFSAKYRDFVGSDGKTRRYTVVYGNGPDAQDVADGVKQLTANVWGVEPSGNGGGSPYVDVFDQFYHWMVNFGPLGNYLSGSWLLPPTWDPVAAHCKISRGSWGVARDAAAAAFGNSLSGAGIIKDLASMRDWMARWSLCCDSRYGQNAAGQWILAWQDTAATPSATYKEPIHVKESSATFEPLHDQHWNYHPYQFALNPTTNEWLTGEEHDQTSIDDYGGDPDGKRPAGTIDLFFIRSASVAAFIMQRRLARHKTLPWRVTFTTIDLCGTNSDLGDVIGLTATWGLGVSGWQNFPLQVEGHIVDPDEQTVTISGRTNVEPQT